MLGIPLGNLLPKAYKTGLSIRDGYTLPVSLAWETFSVELDMGHLYSLMYEMAGPSGKVCSVP